MSLYARIAGLAHTSTVITYAFAMRTPRIAHVTQTSKQPADMTASRIIILSTKHIAVITVIHSTREEGTR